MEIYKENVRVCFEDCGEGLSGEFNEDDALDIPLLRFYVERCEDGEWMEVDNASYCTRVPIYTDPAILSKLLERIMDEVWDRVIAGESIKRICEGLSWMEPSWVE